MLNLSICFPFEMDRLTTQLTTQPKRQNTRMRASRCPSVSRTVHYTLGTRWTPCSAPRLERTTHSSIFEIIFFLLLFLPSLSLSLHGFFPLSFRFIHVHVLLHKYRANVTTDEQYYGTISFLPVNTVRCRFMRGSGGGRRENVYLI